MVLNSSIEVKPERFGPSSEPLLTDAAGDNESMIYVRGGEYSKNYKITILSDTGNSDNIFITHSTPDGTDVAHSAQISTDYIANRLGILLNAASTTQNWSFVANDNVISITNADSDYTVKTSDGSDDENMYSIKDDIGLISRLPPKAPIGFKVAVSSTLDSVVSRYYVVAKSLGDAYGTFGSCYWSEDVAPLIQRSIDWRTLPAGLYWDVSSQQIFFDSDTTYYERTAGDDETNPMPLFVGNKLTGMFFWKNRLCVMTNDKMFYSESGELRNFFRTSVQSVLASDAFVYEAKSEGRVEFKYAIQWEDKVILSAGVQYSLTCQGALTAQSINFSPTTSYNADETVKPVVSGKSIFFTTNKGQFSNLLEYYIENTKGNQVAKDVSSQVPTYIPKNIKILESSQDAKNVILVSEEDPSIVYVYQYQWNGAEKVQSSFYRYDLGTGVDIISAGFIENKLRLFSIKDSKVSYNTIEFSEKLLEDDGRFKICLDNRIKILATDTLGVYDSPSNTTVYTSEKIDVLTENLCAVDISAGDSYANPFDIVSSGVGVITLTGDTTAKDLVIGNTYSSEYELSDIYLRDRGVAITGGNTQIKYIDINFTNSHVFKVRVENLGRTARDKLYTGRIIGDIENVFGKINLSNGNFRVPVGSRNNKTKITLINDSYFPSEFQHIDVDVMYNTRGGRRVG